jgi:hypothetical protein
MPNSGTVPTNDPERQFNAEQLFSLKEWMAAISSKLDRLEQKLDTKADLSHVRDVEIRVGTLEKQVVEGHAEQRYLVPQHMRMLEEVGVLNSKMSSIASVDSYRRWVWGVAFASFINSALAVAALLVR